MKNINLILTFVCVYALAFVKAKKHPFTPLDLVTVNKLNTHSVSPNYEYMVYDVNKYHHETNKKENNLYIMNLKTNSTVQLTKDNTDLSPFWLNNNTIGFFSARSGSVQLWYSPLDFENLGILSNKTMTQITNFPTSVNNFLYNEKSQRLLFSAQSFLNGTMVNDETYVEHEENVNTSGKVYEKLFIRHWDTFLRPSVREQLFVVDLKSENGKFSLKNKPVNIMEGQEMESPVAPFGDAGDFAISPDGQTIAFTSRVEDRSQAWNTNTNVYLVKYPIDGKPGKIQNLTKSNPSYDTLPRFSPDGKWIAYLEMRTKGYEADRNRLMLYNIKSKTHTEVGLKWDRSPESTTWSSDSKTLYITATSFSRGKIYTVKLNDILKSIEKKKSTKVSAAIKEIVATGTSGAIEVIPKGKFNDNKNEVLIFTRSTITKPNEVYRIEVLPFEKLQVEDETLKVMVVPKSEAGLVQVTNINKEFYENVSVSESEEFYFKGYKNDLIHGWILKPVEFEPSKKYPLAFLIHGGPQGCWNQGFSSRWNVQAYTGAGYVVVGIDFHGSSGYGEKFQRSVSKHWTDPYEDLMKGLDYVLKKYDYIDDKKICAVGGSFGGYMVNWINGHTDRFQCLVNHDGVFDTVHAYYTTEELFFFEYEFGGTPYDEKAKKNYDKFNPREYVKNWKTPTLIIHGANDYRLVDGEGIGAFTALQRQGVKSRLLYFPDENHWVLKQPNLLFWYQNIFEWLEMFTKN